MRVLLFYANWCGHCTNFKPTWNQLKQEYGANIKFEEYEANTDAKIMDDFKIKSYPTLMFSDHDDDNKMTIYNGARDYETLKQKLTVQSGGYNNMIEKCIKRYNYYRKIYNQNK